MVDNVGIEESLSALMDSECQDLETRRILKEVSRDSELRDRWHRYQMASAAMKRDLPAGMIDLSSSISAALEAEPAHKPGFKTFLQPLGKVAIAASVALVAVLGVQELQQNPAVQTAPPTQVATTPDQFDQNGAAQFQLPAGVDLPPVAARTASAGMQYDAPQARPTLVVTRRQVAELRDETVLHDYLNGVMERHTRNAANASSSQGLLPLARLPQAEDN